MTTFDDKICYKIKYSEYIFQWVQWNISILIKAKKIVTKNVSFRYKLSKAHRIGKGRCEFFHAISFAVFPFAPMENNRVFTRFERRFSFRVSGRFFTFRSAGPGNFFPSAGPSKGTRRGARCFYLFCTGSRTHKTKWNFPRRPGHNFFSGR